MRKLVLISLALLTLFSIQNCSVDGVESEYQEIQNITIKKETNTNDSSSNRFFDSTGMIYTSYIMVEYVQGTDVYTKELIRQGFGNISGNGILHLYLGIEEEIEVWKIKNIDEIYLSNQYVNNINYVETMDYAPTSEIYYTSSTTSEQKEFIRNQLDLIAFEENPITNSDIICSPCCDTVEEDDLDENQSKVEYVDVLFDPQGEHLW